MKWDTSGLVEEVVWNMRLADLPRGENRAILQRLYNGEPPFDPSKAEENQNEINRNFLEGPNLLTQARRQWNNGFLKPGNYFTVKLDSGPIHKRDGYGHVITRNINRELKACKDEMECRRGTGANVMLHGIGPSNWADRRNPVPDVLPISSLMIPSETNIDFKNLSYFAVFREMTPAQLYGMTHGPKVDPGWQMKVVDQKIKEVAVETQKQPNATSYQYMPEKIEELLKQDGGFWGSDAVPTIDYWDFYFREDEDGKGWYRRCILDWGVDVSSSKLPTQIYPTFLYTSKDRKYANSLSEILHCQFGDCSAYAPFKYHSVRSLGWMMWGVCDLQNRLRCRFSESVFEQLLWFFRVSSGQEFDRIKKAMFTHMGVIPAGVNFITADERFKPDANLIEMQLMQNRQLMSESASAYTQDSGAGGEQDKTATQVMAETNAVNALVSGMLNLAYEYEKFKDIEECRRFCIKNSPYLMSRRFRAACLREGVPPEMLDHNRWIVEPERTLAGGNKTLEIAQANQLLAMRKNVGPDAQRKIDHIAFEAFTDDPALAESLAPLEGERKVSTSEHNAQVATDRILRGLEYKTPPEGIPEDFVKVWLNDMGNIVKQIQDSGGVGTPEDVKGLGNLAQHIHDQLAIMAANDDDKDRVRQYGDALGKLTNFVKAFQQRQAKAAQAAARQAQDGNGAAAIDAKTQATIRGMQVIDNAKAQNLRESHAIRTGQKQAQFELEQQRKDRQANIDLRREGRKTRQELVHEDLRTGQELAHEGARTGQELHHNNLRTLNEIENTPPPNDPSNSD